MEALEKKMGNGGGKKKRAVGGKKYVIDEITDHDN
jgi:hypothetical protein